MAASTRHELLDGLRSVSRPRVAACKRKRIAPTVQIQHRPDGGISRCGVLSCGSVWACPVCASKIYLGRADELKGAMRGWQGSTLLLTATLRHWRGSSLRELRKALSKAWGSLWSGRRGLQRRKAWGLTHTVRALEVTHGANGWHPHLHVLAFTTHTPDPQLVNELKLAWITAVEKKLGRDNTPDFDHGLDVRVTSCAEYLAKLGLEVASIQTKQAQGASRTPWQIAQDAARGDEPSKRLWKSYCRDMLGARQLCWSKGAKKALGVLERDDQELAEEQLGVGHIIAEWGGQEWDACARAFPRWSTMVEEASGDRLAILELHKLPLAKTRSAPGVIRAFRSSA